METPPYHQVIGHFAPSPHRLPFRFREITQSTSSSAGDESFFWHHQSLANQLLLLFVCLLACFTGLIWSQLVPLLEANFYFMVLMLRKHLATRSFSIMEVRWVCSRWELQFVLRFCLMCFVCVYSNQGWQTLFHNDAVPRSNQLLAVFGFIFVTVLPLIHCVFMFLIWAQCWRHNRMVILYSRQSSSSARKNLMTSRAQLTSLSHRAFSLRHWTIADVYLVGAIVLVMEMGNFGSSMHKSLEVLVTPDTGMYILCGTVLLEWACVYWLQRLVHEVMWDDETDVDETSRLLDDSHHHHHHGDRSDLAHFANAAP
jgi:hypothetical protein